MRDVSRQHVNVLEQAGRLTADKVWAVGAKLPTRRCHLESARESGLSCGQAGESLCRRTGLTSGASSPALW